MKRSLFVALLFLAAVPRITRAQSDTLLNGFSQIAVALQFFELEELLDAHYADTVPERHERIMGALRGILSSLDDPHAAIVSDSEMLMASTSPRMPTSKIYNDVVYFSVPTFERDAEPYIDAIMFDALKRIRSPRFVVDLRGNRGGDASVAERFAAYWLRPGDVFYCVEQRGIDTPRVITTEHPRTARETPTVVLVDGQTASAAEVVAGALQDYKHALVVGDTTYGKNTVQLGRRLRCGCYAIFTMARWTTPLGRTVGDYNGVHGIIPDLPFDTTPFQDIVSLILHGVYVKDELFEKAYALVRTMN